MKLRNYLFIGTLLVGLAAGARAQSVVNVMFTNIGTYNGSNALGTSTSNDYWNAINCDPNGYLGTAWGGLYDVSGITQTPLAYTEWTADTGEFLLGGLPNPGGPDLFFGYAHRGSGGDMQFTISGLQANTAYDLYVYTGRDLDYFTVGASETSTVTSGNLSRSATYSGPQTAFIEGTNYVHFSGLVDNSGTVSFASTAGIVNGFTIAGTAVPEPSTYAAIAGAAMLGLAVWRRRRAAA